MKQPRDSKGRYSKMISSLKDYLETTPTEVKQQHWQEVKSLNLKGPTPQELIDSFKVRLYKEGVTLEYIGTFTIKQAKLYMKKWGGSYILK